MTRIRSGGACPFRAATARERRRRGPVSDRAAPAPPPGGAASFISADGWVMPNHHVGADTLQKISTSQRDYIKTGFYARTREEEVKSPDLELNVLMSMEDVTERVNGAVKSGMSAADAYK